MSTSFIEYRGEFYVNDDNELSISDLYFLAQHSDIPNIRNLLKIVKNHIQLGCIYNQEIMEKIKPIADLYYKYTSSSK
jgi:hypothetical protein